MSFEVICYSFVIIGALVAFGATWWRAIETADSPVMAILMGWIPATIVGAIGGVVAGFLGFAVAVILSLMGADIGR